MGAGLTLRLQPAEQDSGPQDDRNGFATQQAPTGQTERPAFRALPSGAPDALELQQQRLADRVAANQQHNTNSIPLSSPEWWEDLRDDVNRGGGKTFIGRGLKAMGAEGILSDPDIRGAAPLVAGPLIGPTNMGLGASQFGRGQIRQGVINIGSGLGQTLAPFAAFNPELEIASQFLPEAAAGVVTQNLANRTIAALGGDPEAADFLTNLLGIGLSAYAAMRGARAPSFTKWRDSNFTPAEGSDGIWVSRRGQSYTEEQLGQIHELLRQQASNPLFGELFQEPSQPGATVELGPYGGPGGGHHLVAKALFKNLAGHDSDESLAISRPEMERLGIAHGKITPGQQQGYIAFGKTGRILTWDDVERIENQAAVNADVNPDMARYMVRYGILDEMNVIEPSWIPWVGENRTKR